MRLNRRNLSDHPAEATPMAKKTKPMAKKNKKEPKSAGGRRYRDALTGRFVTRKYAKKNRETTAKAW
jgi:hypothetical protein